MPTCMRCYNPNQGTWRAERLDLQDWATRRHHSCSLGEEVVPLCPLIDVILSSFLFFKRGDYLFTFYNRS